MAELKIPKLKNNSKQFLFKNKIYNQRKSKLDLFKESFFMLLGALLLIFINYLIPNKLELFGDFNNNLSQIINNFIQILIYFYEVLVVFFIIISTFISSILIIGVLNRLLKVLLRKNKKIMFR
mgnify:CR=1 FL=1